MVPAAVFLLAQVAGGNPQLLFLINEALFRLAAPSGFEPPISASTGRRVSHYTTGPHDHALGKLGVDSHCVLRRSHLYGRQSKSSRRLLGDGPGALEAAPLRFVDQVQVRVTSAPLAGAKLDALSRSRSHRSPSFCPSVSLCLQSAACGASGGQQEREG